jgi:hypothetical protein
MKKNIAKTIAVLILLAILAGGGFYFFKKGMSTSIQLNNETSIDSIQNSSDPEKIQSQPNSDGDMPSQESAAVNPQEPAKISPEAPVKIENPSISNLQTYNNKNFSFKLSYPNGWHLEERSDIRAFGIFIDSPERQKQIESFKNGTVMGVGPSDDVVLNVYKNPEKSLDAFIAKQPFEGDVQKIDLGGPNVFGGIIKGDVNSYQIFRENKGIIFEFVLRDDVKYLDKISPETKAILTSLKF